MLIRNKNVLKKQDLLVGDFGLEREALRIDPEGKVAKTFHPEVFGDRTKNPFITTDFAEAQVEMVTPVCRTLEEVYAEITLINKIVLREIGDELLWPYSMPPVVDAEERIEIAHFPDNEAGRKARGYREMLLEKYGYGPQLISGIHYNFSFSEAMLRKLYEASDKEKSFKTFKDDVYLKICRNYLNYHWFLVYYLGASPTGVDIDEKGAVSLRNSCYGYQNFEDLKLSYESASDHVASIKRAVDAGLIVDEREIYSPIRLKHPKKGDMLANLVNKGIMYLELRSVDLNPFELAGISLDALKFIHLFVLTLLEIDEDVTWNPKEMADLVALEGLTAEAELAPYVKEMRHAMKRINDSFSLGFEDILEEREPFVRQVLKADFLALAKAQKEEATQPSTLYQTFGYEDMEMSTQLLIAECIKRGVSYEILDRPANFLKLSVGETQELVKQASKTSLDTYVSYLAMENKEVTKKMLEKSGFPVPAGKTFLDVETALADVDSFIGRHVVVKPKTTNFGLGIVMFRPLTCKDAFEDALEIAFGFDHEVIVEDFIVGQEYRFLVVDHDVIAVLKRVGANVVGDGVHTIAELVEKKNAHPWRGTGHLAPLEKMVLGEIEVHNLKAAGYTPESIVADGEVVALRDNSNISTGGDSIDVTDQVHDFFKVQAVAAAHALGSRICGVDLIIDGDLNSADSPYGFIELNFNPALHMHAFVLEGKGRNATPYILKALSLIDEI